MPSPCDMIRHCVDYHQNVRVQVYNITHELNCKKMWFCYHQTYNNVRDFQANLLTKVCNDVETEPELQPLSGEHISGLTGDEARPNIRAQGIWRPG